MSVHIECFSRVRVLDAADIEITSVFLTYQSVPMCVPTTALLYNHLTDTTVAHGALCCPQAKAKSLLTRACRHS